jgi:hypothetical protein
MATEPELKRRQAEDALTDSLKAMIRGDDATALEKIEEAYMMFSHLVKRQDEAQGTAELESFEGRQMRMQLRDYDDYDDDVLTLAVLEGLLP